jgi:hypothetical protein
MAGTEVGQAAPATGKDVGPIASASPGETVFLHIELDDDLAPEVEVQFEAKIFEPADDDTRTEKITRKFSEKLQCEPSKLRDGSTAAKAFRIAWVVKSGPQNEPPPYDVTFSVTGKSKADPKQGVSASSTDVLSVPRIKVTANKTLRNLMLHEFNKPDDSFDQQPLDDFLATLTPQQRRLLLNAKVKKPDEGRLIVFATFYSLDKAKKNLMGADMCPHAGPRPLVHPNASFSVFHVRGPGKDVALALHTEFLVINRSNTFVSAEDKKNGTPRNTPTWLMGPQTVSGKSLPSPQWLDPKLEAPLQYKLAVWVPATTASNVDEGVIYLYPLTPTGGTFMPGNGWHGMINTIGCWMLFRNFNWPRDKFKDFNHVYNDIYRRQREREAGFKAKLAAMKPPVKNEDIDAKIPKLPQSWRDRLTNPGKPLTPDEQKDAAHDTFVKTFEDALADLGYNVRSPAPAGTSTSIQKFAIFDRNFAYAWFQRHIVGVKAFSNRWTFTGQAMNFTNVTGRKLEPSFTVGAPQNPKPVDDTAEEFVASKFIHHDGFVRATDEKGWKPDESLFGKNALGFQTASSFISGLGQASPAFQGKTLEDCFWADIYFYKADDAPWPPPFPDDPKFGGE